MLRTAAILLPKALSIDLPVTLAWAIRFGREMKAPVGEASLELAGLVFPTGQGYELKLAIN